MHVGGNLLGIKRIDIGEIVELVALQILQNVPFGWSQLQGEFQELKIEVFGRLAMSLKKSAGEVGHEHKNI